MSNKKINIIAAILLIILFAVSVQSIKHKSLTFDELAHLPAGYSYLAQKDYRLNPEHPPLIKDLSAVPLLAMDLNFPKEDPSWHEGSQGRWWVQFNFGSEFLYRSGNNADKIIFWGRIPMILLLVLLGIFLFKWTRELAGNKPAILLLTLFSFSPTLIAHGRLVTTDVGAALGAVLSIYYYLKFLKNPTKKNILLAGIALGISLLFKFSLILIFPLIVITTLIFTILNRKDSFIKTLIKYKFLALAVIAIAVLGVIWPVYKYHTQNYPTDLQYSEAKAFLVTTTVPKPLINLNLKMIKNPITKPLAQYSQGLLMATNRTATGNTTYFLGKVSAEGWWYYFPVVFFLKTPLPLNILILISIVGNLLLLKSLKSPLSRLKNWIKNHFTEFSIIVFLIIYWTTSMIGSLNIGIRHLLPTFPFIYILVSLGIKNWIKNIDKKALAKLIVLTLIIWYAISSLMAFPNYLTYFNQAVGGSGTGHKYVVDSNLDWGQDLNGLELWMKENNINKIYIDYFGGADLDYYLKDKYTRWESRNKDFPRGNYLAVSATQLQGGRGKPAKGYDQPTDYYMWLNNQELKKVIGNSIFIFYVK